MRNNDWSKSFRTTTFEQRRRARSIRTFQYAVIGVVFVALFVIAGAALGGYFERDSVVATVNDKERVCDSNRDCKYLIFTDAGTFKITDALLGTQRFNSSDLYGRIKTCNIYNIESYGFRIPLFSEYPNVVEVRDLGPAENC